MHKPKDVKSIPPLGGQISDMRWYCEPLDALTDLILIAVPPDRIVFLQGIFDLYEGIGTVRTIDADRHILGILVPHREGDDCVEEDDAKEDDRAARLSLVARVLVSIRPETGWTGVEQELGSSIDVKGFLSELEGVTTDVADRS